MPKDGTWVGFAARSRVLIYNIKLVKKSNPPQSIFELTDPKWKGKVAMSYPLFGPTATHVAALYVLLGSEKAESFLKALKENKVIIVDGNSVVRDIVVEGEAAIGFTDTDDAHVAIKMGKPVDIIYPDKEGIGTLLIPNTISLIKGAPHPKEAKVWNHPWTNFIYGSSAIIIFGYVARFIPFGIWTVQASLKQIPIHPEEAGTLVTSRCSRILKKIVLPLCYPGLAAGLFIIFILSLGELATTLLIIPPGQSTLPIKIYNLMHYGADNMVAALSLILIGIIIIFSVIFLAIYRLIGQIKAAG